MIKGSHIIVPRLYQGDCAFIRQNPDKRIVFAIPYEYNFTLIGTTDIPFESEPASVTITPDEIAYLCEGVVRYFRVPITPADVVRTYSGVRPLYGDHAANASAVMRDYVLDVEGGSNGQPTLLSVFGGKITTYRRLAEHALEKLLPAMGRPIGTRWTADSALPGGDMPGADFTAYLRTLTARYTALPPALLHRLARAYGTRAERILGTASTLADLGEDFGAGLTGAELAYLTTHEWAREAEDVLWRRSKLALHVPQETSARVAAHLQSIQPQPAFDYRNRSSA